MQLSKSSLTSLLEFCDLPASDVSLIGLTLQRRFPGSPSSFVSCAHTGPIVPGHASILLLPDGVSRRVFVRSRRVSWALISIFLDFGSPHQEILYRNPQYYGPHRSNNRPPLRTHTFRILRVATEKEIYTYDISGINRVHFYNKFSIIRSVSSHSFTNSPYSTQTHQA
jgi:hypothetical protein